MSDIIHVIKCNSDPTVAPTREGQHWVNTVDKKTWLSVGTSSVNDWIEVSGGIVSVNGDTGPVVVLDASDIGSTPSGNISSTNLQAAINELDSEKQSISQKGQPNGYASLDGSGLVPAAQLPSYVDDVLEYANFAALPGTGETGKIYVTLDNNKTYRWSGSIYVEISTAPVVSVFGRLGAVIAVAGDYIASQITNTPAGTISSTDVQAAINELDSEKANKTITLTAGTGLSGGGDLSANRTFNIANTTVTAASYGSASLVPTYTVNAQGQLTASANVAIAVPSTQITDFVEAVQDVVGGLIGAGSGISVSYNDVSNTLTISCTITQYTDALARAAISVLDSVNIDFSYNSSTGVITGSVIAGGVNHNALQNYVANEHINHTSVAINAGAGLIGGGDLTATRTISMPVVATAGSYGSTTLIPVITIDVYGRVTSVSTVSVVTDSVWVDAGGFVTWSDETGKDLVIRQASSSGSAYIRQVQSRGTLASPTAVLSGDRLGGNGFYGWNSSGQDALPSVAYNAYATQNHTPTAQGGQAVIEVIPNGTTTPVTAAIFDQNSDLLVTGAVSVGDTTSTTNGLIRLNGSEMQVREDGAWKPFTNTPISLTATSAVSTTSATFATVGSMTTTPAAGSYLVHFTCSAQFSTSNSTGDFSLFIAGSEVAVTRRTIANGAATAVRNSIAISTLITVNGSQVVDIRFRENASATLTANERQLILVPYSR